MFCTECGSKIPAGGLFCENCGARVKAAPVPAAPKGPSIGASGQVVATPVSRTADPNRSAKCAWCGEMIAVDHHTTTCPKCGASLNAATVQSRSGWAKLPGRKDMAKLQFGNSSCQIEGNYVPVADLNLAPTDSIYFTHHVLLWKDPQVPITTMSMKGGWKRLLGGMPLFMLEARGPGHIAFSQDSAGELIAMPLQHGQSIDVREHLFLAATGNVEYDWLQCNIWFQTRRGNETETCYPMGRVLDQFTATNAPGLLLLHAAGNVFVRVLEPGQTILVKPTALVFKDPSVNMELYYEQPASLLSGFFSSNRGYIWLRLHGPGRVAIQSVFERMEGEDGNISGSSGINTNNFVGGMVGGILGSVMESVFDSDGESSGDSGSSDWGSSDSGSSDSGGSGDW